MLIAHGRVAPTGKATRSQAQQVCRPSGARLLAAALSLAVLLLSPSAFTGCPQAYGKCLAVVELEARLEDAPACLHVENVAPENGCVCSGSLTLVNDCDFAISAADFKFSRTNVDSPPSGEASLAPHDTTPIYVSGGVAKAAQPGELAVGNEGEHQVTLGLVGDGQGMALKLEATVDERGSEEAGCSVPAAAPNSASLVAWLGLCALGLCAWRRGCRPTSILSGDRGGADARWPTRAAVDGSAQSQPELSPFARMALTAYTLSPCILNKCMSM